jgi:hypothetical protein
MQINQEHRPMRNVRAAALLCASLTVSGCGTSNGVLQAYPSNAGYNAVSSVEAGRVREITLWRGPSGGLQPLRVAVWCEPHQAQQGGFSAGSCAFNILLEDYERLRPVAVSPFPGVNAAAVQDMPPLAEQFADCANIGAEEGCRQKRNVLQSFLMKTAHTNCLSYLRRVFAAKEIGDTSVSVLKDALTGGSVVGAAAGSPPVAGALGLLNLLTGSYSKVDTAMFQGATARVLADAIELAQKDYLANAGPTTAPPGACTTAGIADGSTYTRCDVFNLLEFANGYASACSLRNGLGILEANVTATKAQKSASEAANVAREALTKTARHVQTDLQQLPAVAKKANDATTGIDQLKTTVNALTLQVQKLSGTAGGAVSPAPIIDPAR